MPNSTPTTPAELVATWRDVRAMWESTSTPIPAAFAEQQLAALQGARLFVVAASDALTDAERASIHADVDAVEALIIARTAPEAQS